MAEKRLPERYSLAQPAPSLHLQVCAPHADGSAPASLATNKAPAASRRIALTQVNAMPTTTLQTSTPKKSPARASSTEFDKAMEPKQARRTAIAKAKAIAPDLAARIGSTPQTKYRGNPDIFGRLVQDHDRHRALLAMVSETTGKSTDRKKLFKELTLELKSHAAAEEQALWSSVLRNPETTEDARHAVAEHKEIDDMLADLAARDMASPSWLRRFAALREEYLHHIREEEQEQFVAAEKKLLPTELRYMKQVFNRRKKEEKASTSMEKKIKLKD